LDDYAKGKLNERFYRPIPFAIEPNWKTYYDSIQEKIDGVAAERFYYALLTSYPFLNQSANVVISRANSIKDIASEVGFDRYNFSTLWSGYLNSSEALKESNALYNLDFFISSNAYSSITHAAKQNKDIASSIISYTIASRKIRDIENIIEMDSIIHIADQAKQSAYKCQDAISDYANDSHDINDWKNFDSMEYSKRISKYIKLKEEPFSLFDYFFKNSLDEDK
jgi:hypothetical protein